MTLAFLLVKLAIESTTSFPYEIFQEQSQTFLRPTDAIRDPLLAIYVGHLINIVNLFSINVNPALFGSSLKQKLF